MRLGKRPTQANTHAGGRKLHGEPRDRKARRLPPRNGGVRPPPSSGLLFRRQHADQAGIDQGLQENDDVARQYILVDVIILRERIQNAKSRGAVRQASSRSRCRRG